MTPPRPLLTSLLILIAVILAGVLFLIPTPVKACDGICRTQYIQPVHVTESVYPFFVPTQVTFFQFLPALLPVPVGPTSPASGIPVGQTPTVASTPQSAWPTASYGATTTQQLASPSSSSSLIPLFKSNCASCHTAGQRTSGGVHIFDQAGNFKPNRDLDDLWMVIKQNRMPPGRPVDAQTKAQFRSLILK